MAADSPDCDGDSELGVEVLLRSEVEPAVHIARKTTVQAMQRLSPSWGVVSTVVRSCLAAAALMAKGEPSNTFMVPGEQLILREFCAGKGVIDH